MIGSIWRKEGSRFDWMKKWNDKFCDMLSSEIDKLYRNALKIVFSYRALKKKSRFDVRYIECSAKGVYQ